MRISGTWIRQEKWNCFGYAWDNGDMPEVNVSDHTGKMNFLSCLWAILNGEKQALIYKADVGGKRGRTAFGFKANGEMVIQRNRFPLAEKNIYLIYNIADIVCY